MIIIIYEMITIPFRMSFEEDNNELSFMQNFDFPFDIIFMTDIMLNLNTSVYINGQNIKNRKIIIMNYLKLWFWLDLVSSFPYSLVI